MIFEGNFGILKGAFKKSSKKKQKELKERAREILREENKGVGEEGLKFILGREMVVLPKVLGLMGEEVSKQFMNVPLVLLFTKPNFSFAGRMDWLPLLSLKT